MRRQAAPLSDPSVSEQKHPNTVYLIQDKAS